MSKAKIYLLNTLIIFYLTVIYFTGVPETNTFNERLKKQLNHVAFALGIWPSWSMFAPNPIKFDSKTYAVITYQDGSNETVDVENPVSGILRPFRAARWMKYSQDNLRNPRLTALRPLATKHLKHRYETESKIVTRIELKRVWRDIIPFKDTGKLPPLDNSYTPQTNSEVLYTAQYGN